MDCRSDTEASVCWCVPPTPEGTLEPDTQGDVPPEGDLGRGGEIPAQVCPSSASW